MSVTIQGLFQLHFGAFSRSRGLSLDQQKAGFCLQGCRTQSMGQHLRFCPQGHVREVVDNSCRHRCCQRCNAYQRQQWLQRWSNRLLPCPHHHVIFTVPHELLDLWRFNRAFFANCLFQAASQALRELMADPKYCGGRVGLLAALHTWSQTLAAHVHLHVLVTAGGLCETSGRWLEATKECLLPRKVLMIVFRGKLRSLLLQALAGDQLTLPPGTSHNRWVGELNRLGRVPWNVKVFGRYQHARGVANYLARYMRGGPIGDHRLLKTNGEQVLFRYRVPNQRTGDRSGQAVMALESAEFLRRYLEHVPPKGLQTVRGYGLYSGNQHSRLSEAFEALGRQRPSPEQDQLDLASWLAEIGLSADAQCCPVCGCKLEIHHQYQRPWRKLARSPPPPSVQVDFERLILA